jgi:hypothetical protein
MHLNAARRRIALAVLIVWTVCGAWRPAWGQAPQPASRRALPGLPGAVERPPAWLVADKGVPFDLKAYFAPVPAEQNAAPLYLDALFEFSGDVAGCFPEGRETESRKKAASERGRRVNSLLEALGKGDGNVDRTALAAVLAEHRSGFAKLERAQKRPRCVFAHGLDSTALVSHAQAARAVTRVSVLRTIAALDKGDINEVIGQVALNLRLARDLEPRGPVISHLVAIAITRYTIESIVKPALRSPRITVPQCERLLRVLTDHETQAIDGYSECLKTEYLTVKVTLHELAPSHGRGGASSSAKREELLKSLAGMGLGNGQLDSGSVGALLAQATPQQFDRASSNVDRLFRDLLGTAKLPHAQRGPRVSDLVQAAPRSTGPERIVQALTPAVEVFVDATMLNEATVHATQCLIAVRRWQLSHKAFPTDLAAACREAKLPSVPRDPYDNGGPLHHDGAALKYHVHDGQPVVYSVGKDGNDDGGTTDNRFNTQPGDLTFRLTPRP